MQYESNPQFVSMIFMKFKNITKTYDLECTNDNGICKDINYEDKQGVCIDDTF